MISPEVFYTNLIANRSYTVLSLFDVVNFLLYFFSFEMLPASYYFYFKSGTHLCLAHELPLSQLFSSLLKIDVLSLFHTFETFAIYGSLPFRFRYVFLRAEHFRYFFIFSIIKMIFFIFYQVNLTRS